jgi:hypothetical protein
MGFVLFAALLLLSVAMLGLWQIILVHPWFDEACRGYRKKS